MISFSVIVPTYNRKEQLEKCIESIKNQDFDKNDFEVIVVDGGSTDSTNEFLETQGVVCIMLEERVGPGKARNLGGRKAKGKYLAFTDSDCLVPRDWLSKLKSGYDRRSNVSGVGGSTYNPEKSVFAQHENFIYTKYVTKQEEYASRARDEAPFALGNMSYDRELFLALGGFNESIPYFVSGEDADFKERLLQKGHTVLFVPITVIHNHTYTLKNFYNQSLQRGAGRLFDSRKKENPQNVVEILLRLVVTPLYFLAKLAAFRGNLRMTFVDSLFFVFSNLGKLIYYKKVMQIKI